MKKVDNKNKYRVFVSYSHEDAKVVPEESRQIALDEINRLIKELSFQCNSSA